MKRLQRLFSRKSMVNPVFDEPVFEESSIPQAPPLIQNIKPKCKIVIASGKIEEGYCIVGDDLTLRHTETKLGDLYELPGTRLLVDKMSRNLFRDPEIKAFVLVPKMLGSDKVVIGGEPIYVLHPLQKDDFARYESKSMGAKEVEIEYKPPKVSASGTYGEVEFYPTSRIALKKSKTKLAHNELSEDMLKEIAIYRLLKEISCLPKFFGFDIGGTVELEFELGTGTLSEAIPLLDVESIIVIMFRVCKCLRSSASQGIIHCDLKPSNMIISREGKVQIIDWGIAEIDQSLNQEKRKSVHKQTLWYRAPEIIEAKLTNLEKSSYSNKIDIFSLGLIFAEVYSEKVVAGAKDDLYQARTLLRGLLNINRNLVATEENIKREFIKVVTGESVSDRIKNVLLGSDYNKKGVSMPEPMADLISKMLEFNPAYRIEYNQIILHPLFQYMHREAIPKLPIFINNMPIIPDITAVWTKGKMSSKNRRVVFDWIKDVILTVAKAGFDCVCLAWQLLDRVVELKREPLTTKNMQAYACCVILLATKIYSHLQLNFDVMIYNSENSTTVAEQEEIMKEVLNLLDGNLIIPSLYTYASHYGTSKTKAELVDIMIKRYREPIIYSLPFSESWRSLVG